MPVTNVGRSQRTYAVRQDTAGFKPLTDLRTMAGTWVNKSGSRLTVRLGPCNVYDYELKSKGKALRGSLYQLFAPPTSNCLVPGRVAFSCAGGLTELGEPTERRVSLSNDGRRLMVSGSVYRKVEG